MNKMVVVGIVMMLLGLLSGCTEQSDYGNDVAYPEFYVTSKLLRSGYEGIDYVVWVDATIYNGGDSGSQTVFCQINQDNNQYLKSERVYLDAGKSTSLTFRFPEYSWWSSDSGSFLVWIGDR